MEKKNFISKEEVKNLVENGEYDWRDYYLVDIPNQFYNKNNLSEEIQANTAEFQDFLEKAKEEVFYQNRDILRADHLTDIVYDFSLDKSGLGKLTFKNYGEYLCERGVSQKIVHIIEVYLPQPLKNKGKDDYELQDFIKRMTNAVAYSGYTKNTDTATVSWKLTEDEYGEKVIEFTIVEE